MFKKSLLMVALVMTVVFASAFTSQMIQTQGLPSSFDPGLSIDEAFKTSKVPVFIEFYTDTCSTCRKVSPWVHDLVKEKYKDQLTLVMIDVEYPENQQVAQLFGVEELPAMYVFDFKNMKKHPIESKYFGSRDGIDQALHYILTDAIPNTEPRKLDPAMAPQVSFNSPETEN